MVVIQYDYCFLGHLISMTMDQMEKLKQFLIAVQFDSLLMCFVTFMNTMEVCFNDDQHLFAKKTSNQEKIKVGCFLSFLFKWLQNRVVRFNRCNIPKNTYFNTKVKKSPTKPMLNVDYMVINELTNFN